MFIINKMSHTFQAAILILATLLLFTSLFLITFFVLTQKRIFPNISVAEYYLGCKDEHNASQELEKYFQEKKQEKLIFSYQNNTYQIPTNAIELNYLPDESVEKAFQITRNQDWFKNLKIKFQALKNGFNLKPEFKYNQQKWEQKTASFSAELTNPPIPPSLKLENNQIQVDKGREGQEIEKEKLTKNMERNLAEFADKEINIPIKTVKLDLSEEQIENTVKRADQLVGKKIELKINGDTWILEDKDLINFISFKNSYKDEKIASWSAELANAIKTEPQNALFRFENNKVIEFKPAKKGRTLKKAETVSLIKQALQGLEQEQNQIAQITLPINYTEPEIQNSQVNDLGIHEQIGKGESYFRGSVASRIFNLDLASGRLNGILVPPGEEFSFNKNLGEISQQTGYKQAYVIKEGKTVLGDGGGVCQVSTTLFRAAINAGLEVTERHAHAYRVHYYEQNSPLGQDATVYSPSVDFRFKNNTPKHILIQREIDKSNYYLSFQIYGSDDGRDISVSDTRVWDKAPAPPPRYQETPTLPKEEIRQIDWASPGAKASFDYKVTLNDQVLQEKTFYSSYQPWQAVYLKGIGE